VAAAEAVPVDIVATEADMTSPGTALD